MVNLWCYYVDTNYVHNLINWLSLLEINQVERIAQQQVKDKMFVDNHENETNDIKFVFN